MVTLKGFVFTLEPINNPTENVELQIQRKLVTARIKNNISQYIKLNIIHVI